MKRRAGIDLDLAHLLALRNANLEQRQAKFLGAAAPGGKPGRNRGTGVDLYDLRDFVEGDDLRHVDANASARTGKLHVKTYVNENDLSALILIDLRPSMYWGSADCLRAYAAICAGVGLGWQIANANGRAAFLVLRGDGIQELSALDGENGMVAHCEHLVLIYEQAMQLRDNAAPSLGMALLRARLLTKRQTGVFVITGYDDPGDDFREGLAAMRARDCKFLVIRDALQIKTAENLPVIGANNKVQLIDLLAEGDEQLSLLDEEQVPYELMMSGDMIT